MNVSRSSIMPHKNIKIPKRIKSSRSVHLFSTLGRKRANTCRKKVSYRWQDWSRSRPRENQLPSQMRLSSNYLATFCRRLLLKYASASSSWHNTSHAMYMYNYDFFSSLAPDEKNISRELRSSGQLIRNAPCVHAKVAKTQ